MRISDWSSDVCSSDLFLNSRRSSSSSCVTQDSIVRSRRSSRSKRALAAVGDMPPGRPPAEGRAPVDIVARSEEHTSELQSLMRISYAVFCLKKKNISSKLRKTHTTLHHTQMIHNMTINRW